MKNERKNNKYFSFQKQKKMDKRRQE